MVLAWFAYAATKASHAALSISQRQLCASLQPQVLLRFGRVLNRGNGDLESDFTIQNVGQFYFQIHSVRLSFYCVMSNDTHHEPRDFQLLMYRVLAVKEEVVQTFKCNPEQESPHLEPHDGACQWNFALDVEVEDLVGLGRHHYSLDSTLGLHYSSRDFTGNPSWWRRLKMQWGSRYRYRLCQAKKSWAAFRDAKLKKLAP